MPKKEEEEKEGVGREESNSNDGNRQPENHQKTRRNKKRGKRRAKLKCRKIRENHVRLLQQNIAGLKTRKTELLRRLHKLDIDVAVISECNFSVKKDRKTGKISHVIPELDGWNVEATPRQVG